MERIKYIHRMETLPNAVSPGIAYEIATTEQVVFITLDTMQNCCECFGLRFLDEKTENDTKGTCKVHKRKKLPFGKVYDEVYDSEDEDEDYEEAEDEFKGKERMDYYATGAITKYNGREIAKVKIGSKSVYYDEYEQYSERNAISLLIVLKDGHILEFEAFNIHNGYYRHSVEMEFNGTKFNDCL